MERYLIFAVSLSHNIQIVKFSLALSTFKSCMYISFEIASQLFERSIEDFAVIHKSPVPLEHVWKSGKRKHCHWTVIRYFISNRINYFLSFHELFLCILFTPSAKFLPNFSQLRNVYLRIYLYFNFELKNLTTNIYEMDEVDTFLISWVEVY